MSGLVKMDPQSRIGGKIEDRPAFQKLQDFLGNLERQKGLLRNREAELVMELATRRGGFNEAAFQGRAGSSRRR